MPRLLIVTLLSSTFLALAILAPNPFATLAAATPALADLVLVSDDDAHRSPGCDAVSVMDIGTGRSIARGEYIISPGRIASNSDATQIVSISNNSDYKRGNAFVYSMRRQSALSSRWATDMLFVNVLMGSQPAISPDDSVLLLPTASGLDKYDLAGASGRTLGKRIGASSLGPVASMAFSSDSSTAYVADAGGSVNIVDVASMVRQGEPINYSAVSGRTDRRIRNTNSAVSPDDAYLVVNAGDIGAVTVIDLGARSAKVVDTPGLKETWGVAFNHIGPNRGLLAVHGRSSVAVYEFNGFNALGLKDAIPVPPQSFSAWKGLPGMDWPGRVASLAWSGRGDAVVAAIGSKKEFRVLELSSDQSQLTRRLDLDSCESDRGMLLHLDVFTLNDRLAPPPTPTVTPCPTPIPTKTSVATLTPSPTFTPSSTPTVADTATPTPKPTPALQPIYLPLALKEECDPIRLQADVALVIDASTSMLEETREKRTKLSAAVEAVELFLGELNLPLDQAAVVQFNGDVELLQELTGDRGALVDSLVRIQMKRQTRIDLGIAVAREELKSSRRRSSNQAVMIVLTDGRANPVGPDAAVREAEAAQSEGATIFTIGLGEELNLEALEAIASKPAYFYRAPDAEDLADIYSKIAVEIPCPAEDFWGRR